MCCVLQLNSNILCLTFFPIFPQWKKFVGEIISVVVNFLPNFLEDFKHNEVHLFRVRGIDFKIHAKLKAWLLVFHITSTNSISNIKAVLKSKMCNFIRMKEDEKQKKYSFHWIMTSFLQTSLVNALVGFLHASVRSKNNFVRLNENRQWKNTSKWITSITQKRNSSEAFCHLSWLLILFSCFFKTINYHIL